MKFYPWLCTLANLKLTSLESIKWWTGFWISTRETFFVTKNIRSNICPICMSKNLNISSLTKISQISSRSSWPRFCIVACQNPEPFHLSSQCILACSKYFSARQFTSQWLQAGWRTSRCGCPALGWPGRWVFRARPCAGTVRGRSPWCWTGWGAWRGKLQGPGHLRVWWRCLQQPNVSADRNLPFV